MRWCVAQCAIRCVICVSPAAWLDVSLTTGVWAWNVQCVRGCAAWIIHRVWYVTANNPMMDGTCGRWQYLHNECSSMQSQVVSNTGPTLNQRRAGISDAGSTLSQLWVKKQIFSMVTSRVEFRIQLSETWWRRCYCLVTSMGPVFRQWRSNYWRFDINFYTKFI